MQRLSPREHRLTKLHDAIVWSGLTRGRKAVLDLDCSDADLDRYAEDFAGPHERVESCWDEDGRRYVECRDTTDLDDPLRWCLSVNCLRSF